MKFVPGKFIAAIILLYLFTIKQLFAFGEPTIKYLGIEHGLSNNSVICIYQDYLGFMWFGTQDGLNRYDGYEFTVFRNKIGKSSTLSDNTVYNIEGDRNYNLWIGGRKGLSVYNLLKQSFSSVSFTDLENHTDLKLPGSIRAIKPSTNGDVFVGTEHNGLILFKGGSLKGKQIALNRNSGASGNYEVSSIELHEKERFIWVFVENEGLGLYDRNQNSLRIVNTYFKDINCLKADQNGHLWVGTDGGLYLYDIASNSFSGNYFSNQTRIVTISIDKTGSLWLSTDGNGIFILPNSTHQPVPFSSPGQKELLSSNAIFSIYEDKEGRKWIGTLRGGINVMEGRTNPFQTIYSVPDKDTDPAENFINTFCENPDRKLWVGTSGGGLKLWDRHSNLYTHFTHQPQDKSSLSSNIITHIINDFYGNTWIATWNGGVNRFHKTTKSFEHFSCINPYKQAEENNVWLLYEDAQKTLWASTTNNGTLYTLNRSTNQFEVFDHRLVNVQCLTEDRKGTLWGGNYSSLIKVDKVNRRHIHYHIGYAVRSIHEDRMGNFWVGTDGGGLLRFNRKTGKFTRFTTENGLPNNSILRILEDGKGSLWLSTFNGLCRFDPQKKVFKNYTQSDGLQSNQFNFNAALALQSGEMLFGGIKGFTVFHPDSMYEYQFMPKLYLTGLKINNVPVDQGNSYVSNISEQGITELKISYDHAVLSLDFAALEYTAPDKIKYAYYLEGWDKDWYDAGKIRTANYTRLTEGSYSFKIKHTNAEGKWSQAYTLLKIVVLPPWYRSWWVYIIYLLLAGAALYLYQQYRSRQAQLRYEVSLAKLNAEKERAELERERSEREKTQAEYQREKAERETERVLNERDKEINEKRLSFFTNISHEFRTPLTLIINPLKDLLYKAKQEGNGDGNSDELNTVYRNARRLLSLVDQLLLFRKADAGVGQLKITRLDFTSLCREVYLAFVQQAKAAKIEYVFACDKDSLELYGDREQLEILFYNLLSNALKYTPPSGKIVISITETEESVAVSVADSGYGIPQETGDKLFERFFQVPRKGIPAKSGFGIGLYLTKQFVDSHHGKIWYQSEPGRGTTFYVQLLKGKDHFGEQTILEEVTGSTEIIKELVVDEEVVIEKKIAKDGKAELEALIRENKSLLVVDDDEQIRQYIAKIFDQFTVYQAVNGEEGLQLASQYIPDIIISDVNMQGMSGIDLCKTLKEDPALNHIPVILLTGSSSAETKLQGVEGGADDYITKPFEKELLVARVVNLLKNMNNLQKYFYNEVTLQKNPLKISTEYKEFLERCISIVERHIDDENFNVKILASELGISHSNLYKKVKSISGQSVNGFIRFIRLRRAAELLINTNSNVNEAAAEVGFNDTRYFRQQFSLLFGMNPSDYIKKYRKVFGKSFTLNEDGYKPEN